MLGAGEMGSSGFLSSGLCIDNPYYFTIELFGEDKDLINNNFPLELAVVGGATERMDRAVVVAPWLTMVALLGVLAAAALSWRKPDLTA
jgi:hypothetical protein